MVRWSVGPEHLCAKQPFWSYLAARCPSFEGGEQGLNMLLNALPITGATYVAVAR